MCVFYASIKHAHDSLSLSGRGGRDFWGLSSVREMTTDVAAGCGGRRARAREPQAVTALRAPPWAFTLPRVCSHHPRNVSAHALSSPRGIGILAPAPRCDQRAGGRRTRRIPPYTHEQHTHGVPTRHGSQAGSCPPHQYIHQVQSSHGNPAGSPPPVHPLSTIISAAAPVEGGRVGNQ